jgi:cation/acetate symporter
MLNFIFGIFDGGKEAVAGLASEWWLDFGKGGISPEGFGTVAMAVNFIASMVVSRLTPAPPLHVQEIVEHIRIPSGVEEAQGAH